MFVTGPVRSLLYSVCCPSPVWEWTVTARLCPAGRGQAAEAAVWVEATVGVEAPSGRSCRCLRDDSSFLLRQLQFHANSQGRRTEGVVSMAPAAEGLVYEKLSECMTTIKPQWVYRIILEMTKTVFLLNQNFNKINFFKQINTFI